MKLNEVRPTAWFQKPHPMLDRIWMMCYDEDFAPQHLFALWMFQNEDQWLDARRNMKVGDRVMKSYPGHFMIPFKSMNGLHFMGVVNSWYVNEHGSEINVFGAGITEKSAAAAGEKVLKDKLGHFFNAESYTTFSYPLLDNSIFVNDLNEGVGTKVLEFADYLSKLKASPEVKKNLKDLATLLFKEDFEMGDFIFAPKFRFDEESGLGWTFAFPDPTDAPHARIGLMTASFHIIKENDKKKFSLHEWSGLYSAREILEMGLDEFMAFGERSAREM